MRKCALRLLLIGMGLGLFGGASGRLTLARPAFAAGEVATLEPATAGAPGTVPAAAASEVDFGGPGIFSRAMQGGWVVFICLLILVSMSVLVWGVIIAKYVYLLRIGKSSDHFVKSFWDSRSLNDLNGRLADHPYSPVREVFRSGYAELVRGSQLRDVVASADLAVHAALDNMNRSLGKAKAMERRRMERFMPVLSISAAACPFIGLFGTVWGIMGSFEGIARSGSASLAAVAPGISEALISTAFGLAAAIPAVVGYNMFAAKMRYMMATIDGFSADFLNIVERYLVSDKAKSAPVAGHSGPQSPLAERL